MKKVFFNSPLEDFDYKKYALGETFYILPSESAINSKIRSEVISGINIVNTEFMTFDNVSRLKSVKEADDVVKFIVLKKILKKNFKDVEIFDESVDIILEFFDELLRNGKRKKDLEKFSQDAIKSLSNSFEEFYKYFEDRGFCLSTGLSETLPLDLSADTIIIDGFASFRYYEMEFIKKISDDKNVIINIPFNISGNEVIDDTLRTFYELGFEIIKSEETSLEALAKSANIKILNSKDDFYNMFFMNLKKDIVEDAGNIDIITGSNTLARKIRDRSKYHGLDFNMDIMERSLIKEELLALLDFLENKSKKNTIKRLKLFYFAIPVDKIMLEEDLLKQNFSNINDIDLESLTEVEMPKSHLKNYLDGVKFLQSESVKSVADLDYYLDFFKNYIKSLEDGIEDRFNPNIYDYVYVRDRNFSKKILEILDRMKNLKEFYREISYKEFKVIFKKYIEKIKFRALQNRELVDLKNLQSMYYQNFEKLYLVGFDKNYERDRDKNFIYSRKTLEDLKRLKIREDESQIELLELIYAAVNSKETLILIDNIKDGISKNLNLVKKKLNITPADYKREFYSSEIEISNKRDTRTYDIPDELIKKLNFKLSNRIYSVTDFDVLKECPRRFLFERIFKLEEFALEYDDKFYLKMGDRFHNILEKYFKIEKTRLDEDLLKKLVLKENFGYKSYEDLKFLERVQVINDFNFLKEYISADLEDQKIDALVPKYFEKNIEIQIDDIKIMGRIDRIDSSEDGLEESIMDYKSSSSSLKTKKDILNGDAFQIPLYALARLNEGKKFVKANYGVVRNAEVVTVLKNKDLREKKGRVQYYYSSDELQNIFSNSKREIINIVGSLKSGNYESTSKCERCIYTDICINKWGNNG